MAKLDTSIDRLVEYVKLRKSCTVDDAAKSLGMPVKQVEELSEILAESGLIDVRYEFSGIRLFPKMVRKDDDGKGKAERKLTAAERLEGVKRELLEAENMFIFSEKDVRRKVENAKAHFREIEKGDLSQENIESMRAKAADLDSSIRVFEEKIDALEKAALEVRTEVDSFISHLEAQQGRKGGFKLPFAKVFSRIKNAFRRRKPEKKDAIEVPGKAGMQ
ncbi:MAG: hypothetical protein ABIG96_01745 [Candidatus Micrarchaeota archaeon]